MIILVPTISKVWTMFAGYYAGHGFCVGAQNCANILYGRFCREIVAQNLAKEQKNDSNL